MLYLKVSIPGSTGDEKPRRRDTMVLSLLCASGYSGSLPAWVQAQTRARAEFRIYSSLQSTKTSGYSNGIFFHSESVAHIDLIIAFHRVSRAITM